MHAEELPWVWITVIVSLKAHRLSSGVKLFSPLYCSTKSQRPSPGSSTYRITTVFPCQLHARTRVSASPSLAAILMSSQMNSSNCLPMISHTVHVLIPGSGYNLYGYSASQSNFSTTAYTLTDQRQNIDVGSTLTLDNSSLERLRAMSFRISE